MRKAPLLVAFSLLGVAGPAAAEAPKPAPAEARLEAPPSPRPPLNLKLENPSQYLREAPQERSAGDGLPSLGANARPLPPPTPTPSTSTTYPTDSQRGQY